MAASIKITVNMLLLLAVLLAIKLPSLYFDKSDSEYLEERFAAQDFDTVFIGSSRTKFAVIPAYFDKLTGGKTRSFNFGIVASGGDESIEKAAEFIRTKRSLRRIFIELSIFDMDRVNFMEDPWRDLNFRRYMLRARNMSFGELADFHDQLIVRLLRPGMREKRPDYNVGIEKALANFELGKAGKVNSKTLNRSRSYNLSAENGESPVGIKNDWDRVRELIALAESKNIEIRFFITPRLLSVEEMKAVSYLYGKLGEEHKQKSEHYDEFFYTQSTSIDPLHLNHRGAMRFTESLASEIKKH